MDARPESLAVITSPAMMESPAANDRVSPSRIMLTGPSNSLTEPITCVDMSPPKSISVCVVEFVSNTLTTQMRIQNLFYLNQNQ